MDFLQSPIQEEMIKPIKITYLCILCAVLKAFLHCIIGERFLFFSLKTMKTHISNLPYYLFCSTSAPTLDHQRANKTEKNKPSLEKTVQRVPRCIPSSSHIFLKTINTGSPRQTISPYRYFLKANHYYQIPSSLRKKTETL